jgi:hypothetical protein
MRSERTIRNGGRAWRRLFGALALGAVMLLGTLPGPAQAAHYSYHGGGGWGWHGGWGWGGPPIYLGLGSPYYYDPYYDPNYTGYYAPPPVVVAPSAAPAVTQAQPSCQAGTWKQANGTTVNGTACYQSDGTWRLQ